MNIYKKPIIELIVYDAEDVVRTSGVPEKLFGGGEVGESWGWFKED